jgi:hypothetical protein
MRDYISKSYKIKVCIKAPIWFKSGAYTQYVSILNQIEAHL